VVWTREEYFISAVASPICGFKLIESLCI